MPYSNEEKRDMLEIYYASHRNVQITSEKYLLRYPERQQPAQNNFLLLHRNVRDFRSFCKPRRYGARPPHGNEVDILQAEQKPRKLHPRKIPKYRYIHLYPNFEDIEIGNVPSATEIYRMSKIGIQPEYLYPNYYEDVTDEHDESLLYQKLRAYVTNDCVVEKDWAVQLEEQEEQEQDSFQENASYHMHSSLSDTSSTPNLTVDAISSPLGSNMDIINSPLSLNVDVVNSSPAPEDTVPKSKVKPPPGFENISLSTPSTTATITTVTANNSYVPTPQVLMPNVINTTATIPQLLNPSQHQGLPLQPLISTQQTSQPIIGNYNQNILINSVNPFLFSNPPINQANNILYNPYFQQGHFQRSFQASNRTLLQNHLHKCILQGNFNLLRDINNIFNKLRYTPVYEQIYLLMNAAFEMVNNPLLMSTNQAHFGMVVTSILNCLTDEQLLELSTISMMQNMNISNRTVKVQTINTENQERVNVNSYDNEQNTFTENPYEIQENVNHNTNEIEESKPIENVKAKPIMVFRSRVLKTALQNQSIHIILFDKSLYVPVNEVLQYTKPKPTLDVVRKSAMLLDPQNCVRTIYLNEENALTKELQSCGFTDRSLTVLPLSMLPEIVKIHHGEMEEIKDFKGFLNKVVM